MRNVFIAENLFVRFFFVGDRDFFDVKKRFHLVRSVTDFFDTKKFLLVTSVIKNSILDCPKAMNFE